MRKNTARLFLFSSLLSISGMAENRKDSTQISEITENKRLIYILQGEKKRI